MPPAARAFVDMTAHPLPGLLMPGPGSPTVLIGFFPAWRGIPLAAVAALQTAKAAVDTAVAAAQGTPGFAAAQVSAAASMSAAISGAAGLADKHMCATPFPPTPHGIGVDITGSATVQINFLPAGRQGDTILEALGPPNTISKGEPTVIIGG
ncbi:MAG TPA: hypothetical protein VF604_12150 [Pyrinomonadaceae bacterium]|jgi:uncharacterized Zn-binding protein involved in type VI secretion